MLPSQSVIDVVGIGAAGWESLAPEQRDRVLTARLVLGGRRHLDLLPDVEGQQRQSWPTDLRAALPEMCRGHEVQTIAVLASGDPLLAGVGGTLVELFGAAAVRIHPAVSSPSLARARMGWPADTVELVRLRGDDLDLVRRAVFPGRRLLVLSRDAATPGELAEVLRSSGFGPSALTVLGDLGTPEESRVDGRADGWFGSSPALNIVCVECRSDTVGGTWSLAPGLPDEAYEHDGQLTKRHLRASALAHLLPRPGELLVDVGAGAGSVGIEWMRTHPSCRAVAVERDAVRAGRIATNAHRLGVPGLLVVTGSAPEALAGLAQPDAIFIGGGAGTETVDACWSMLRPGGRIVVHAVTQETEVLLAECRRRYGGTLARISVEHLEPLGRFSAWLPARAVVEWSAVKAEVIG